MKHNLKGARFPGRYLQGPGALAMLGGEVAAFAAQAVVLLDGGVFDILQEKVLAALDGKAKAELVKNMRPGHYIRKVKEEISHL